MNVLMEYKEEKLFTPEFGITIDVSLDSNCGVFRRYHVGNNPVNWIDPLGLIRKCIKKLMLVTSYNNSGPGSDWPYYKPKTKGDGIGSVGLGTVAVANTNPKPYPYGSDVIVYGHGGKVDYKGQVHDTGAGWDLKHHNVSPDAWIDIWLPGKQANQWGKQWREVEICYDEDNCK